MSRIGIRYTGDIAKVAAKTGLSTREVRLIGLERWNKMSDDAQKILISQSKADKRKRNEKENRSTDDH